MKPNEAFPTDFVKFPHGFPTKENCDPTNPYQAFLWMLVALPYQKGAQLVLPVDYLQFVSKRLWDCGARPAEAPTVKYQKPAATDPNWLTSPGTWVDVDAPDRDQGRPAEVAVNSLQSQQQAELMKELWSRMTPAQRRQLVDNDDST